MDIGNFRKIGDIVGSIVVDLADNIAEPLVGPDAGSDGNVVALSEWRLAHAPTPTMKGEVAAQKCEKARSSQISALVSRPAS